MKTKGLYNGISLCSYRTWTNIHGRWPKKLGALTPDYFCPDHTKLKGRGQRKLYALVYRCHKNKVDTLLIPDIYDWRKSK